VNVARSELSRQITAGKALETTLLRLLEEDLISVENARKIMVIYDESFAKHLKNISDEGKEYIPAPLQMNIDVSNYRNFCEHWQIDGSCDLKFGNDARRVEVVGEGRVNLFTNKDREEGQT
jgi:hypothetical protein